MGTGIETYSRFHFAVTKIEGYIQNTSDDYSGTPLLWTPWGPGKVSCVERCPHFRSKFTISVRNWFSLMLFRNYILEHVIPICSRQYSCVGG